MEDLKFYIKVRDEKPVSYRFGSGIEATILFVDGGFSTKEEAFCYYAKSHSNFKGKIEDYQRGM